MTKILRKAVMTRSRLENKYQKTMSAVHKENLKKHKNYCNRLYQIESKNMMKVLNLSNITDNKKFWNTMKQFLTDKGAAKTQITLIEVDRIISDDPEVPQTLNNVFDNTIPTLEIKEPIEHIINVNENSDSMDVILRRYSNMLRVIEKSSFPFHETSLADIVLEIYKLDVTRSIPVNTISANHLKDYIDICGIVLYETINYGMLNSVFDDSMKLADFTSIEKTIL